ncbi:hypothetical protein SLE2022_122970 [Rubroshorea leprosula]
MADTEMMEQDVAEASDVTLVDATVQEQESSCPPQVPTPGDNSQSPHLGTADDKTLTLPTDVKLSEPDSHDDKSATDANTNANDTGLTELEEKKSNGNPNDGDTAPIAPAETEPLTPKAEGENVGKSKNWLLDPEMGDADEAGTPEERAEFMKELETFHKENSLEFKPPKFYGEPLNCLKLWRAVIKLGGYDLVTASKLWRQVGESFHPPKTCTTVSWTFRIFYEKALLEYEKHKRQNGEIQLPESSLPPASAEKETSSYQPPGTGRARRDAAARAMQGWHAQRFLGYGEVTEPIVKDKALNSNQKREKNLKSIGLQKHKTQTSVELVVKPVQNGSDKQLVTEVVDIGPPADWVKINVRETRDCFEVYALVPGLLREEVRVQSDPAGRLVITGQPEQLDNPWGITPFKKIVSLPARIDPLQTSAVVSLHGRLFVRVPFEQGSV